MILFTFNLISKLFSSKNVLKPWIKVRFSETIVAHVVFFLKMATTFNILQNHSDSIDLLKIFASGPVISSDSSFGI